LLFGGLAMAQVAAVAGVAALAAMVVLQLFMALAADLAAFRVAPALQARKVFW
jgi:hypothetical protein